MADPSVTDSARHQPDHVVLEHGVTRAVVTRAGAGLRSLTIDGLPVVVSPSAAGAVAGEVRIGEFSDAAWIVAARSPSALTLSATDAHGRVAASVRFALTDDGLESALHVRSPSDPDISVRAWFDPGGAAVDEAALRLDSAGWLGGTAVAPERLDRAAAAFDTGSWVPRDHAAAVDACVLCRDFRALRSLDGVVLNDLFTMASGSRSQCRIRRADGASILFSASSGFDVWHVSTGDGLTPSRAALAVGARSTAASALEWSVCLA